MEGTRFYHYLFPKGEQHGRLYILPGEHARGFTFRIWVLPEGEKVIENGKNPPLNKNAVQVYGVIGGKVGWTERYGWLHEGKWQEDFYIVCEEKKKAREQEEELREELHQKQIEEEQTRVNAILTNY